MESMGRTLVFKFLWEMGTSLNNGIWCQTLISALMILGPLEYWLTPDKVKAFAEQRVIGYLLMVNGERNAERKGG